MVLGLLLEESIVPKIMRFQLGIYTIISGVTLY